ncbi:hypothetical protein IL306_005374 [Fusarium sp. DS 682]|nr:hypothetical protein IL306_005374 [Fusarium sp. DS 682]
MDKQTPKVAVVGLGVAGLVAVKNMLEEGFDVTGFERSKYIGGLWHYTEQDKTSVLPATIINISKERGAFTDFPFPDSTPSHCPSGKVEEYLEAYVDHFNFRDKLRLGVTVERVRRQDEDNRWVVDVQGSGAQYFDKVIMATGGNNRPHIPKVEGIDQFEGEVLHSRAFKRPELFKGKRVLVVGVSNTGADTAASLCGNAEKVWLSHSHGVIVRVAGPKKIELTDGTCLDVDTIIWCTGYKADFSLLDPSVDPTRNTTPKWAEAIGSRGKPLPRLYQNVFSLDYPDSLAFMGNLLLATSAFPISDLCTMAIAQIWKGNSALPSIDEMNRATDKQHELVCKLANEGSVAPGWLRQADWLSWANKAAGAQVYEHLGWGLKGWKLWWSDRALYKMLMDGVFTPFVWRVFDGEGKRKKWDGAREAIEKVNAELAAAKLRAKNKRIQ